MEAFVPYRGVVISVSKFLWGKETIKRPLILLRGQCVKVPSGFEPEKNGFAVGKLPNLMTSLNACC